MELSEVNVSSILVDVKTLRQTLKRNHVENDTTLNPPSATIYFY